MSENNFHTHETCDALPLAVALTQCQQRYARLEVIADRLADAGQSAVRVGSQTPEQLVAWIEALVELGNLKTHNIV